MPAVTPSSSTQSGSIDESNHIWFTRCPVPTASGLAFKLGWLTERWALRDVTVGILQDADLEIAQHHYDHKLVSLIREGGNVPAIAARADGVPTRLIGVTWIDEGQVIIVRPESNISAPVDLLGARIAVPGWSNTRDTSMSRATALHGFKNVLAIAGLNLDDVVFGEIPLVPVLPPGRLSAARNAPRFQELDALLAGEVDAVYVKGAAAREAAQERGLRVAIDLDALPERRSRVNNGTPRPLTVHEDLLQKRPELVVDFLVESLRAADWAAANLDGLRDVLAAETDSGSEGVLLAYKDGFHRSLHPTLDQERVDLLRVQKEFLLRYGFLGADFDFDGWVAPEPLQRALQVLESAAA